MERLKAELRHALKNDAGSDEASEALVNQLLQFLGEYFTPLALDHFSGVELRQMLIEHLAAVDLIGPDEAAKMFMARIGLLPTARQLPTTTLDVDNVVNIFGKR